MAVQRTKSRRDIINQMIRLTSSPDISPARRERIYRISDRYRLNIEKTKSYSNFLKQWNAVNARTYSSDVEANGRNMELARKMLDKASTRQYSRSTYMGTNNG